VRALVDGAGGRVWQRVMLAGDITNAGSITSRGGSATEAAGGDGGRISLESYGGAIRSSERLDAGGGSSSASPTAQGGRGGRVELETHDLSDPSDPRAGDIGLSGAIDVSGGAAESDVGARGGIGGTVYVLVHNDHGSVGQSVHLLGYDTLVAAGADGARIGGHGGDMSFRAGLADAMPPGHVEIEPVLDLSGGDTDAVRPTSAGGDGGEVMIAADTADRGEVDLSGGEGATQGNPGTISEP